MGRSSNLPSQNEIDRLVKARGKVLATLRQQGYFKIEPIDPPLSLPPISQPKDDPQSPRNFDEYIGQAEAKDICRIIVDSANKQERPIPSLLITGSFGLGKTTLAELVLQRHNAAYRLVEGLVASKIVSSLKDYVIIDEIHNLTPEACDYLNTKIDSQEIHIIGCTTNAGELPTPFKSRLREITLDDYEYEDIKVILQNSLKRRGMKAVPPKATEEIALRSRFNPRNALQILDFALELTSLSEHGKLNLALTREAMDKLGIDKRGLRSIDRKYLDILSSIKPTGLTQICSMLSVGKNTIEYDIEPYLLRKGLIEKTSKGRISTENITDDELLELLSASVKIQKRKVFEV